MIIQEIAPKIALQMSITLNGQLCEIGGGAGCGVSKARRPQRETKHETVSAAISTERQIQISLALLISP